jgi:hypothetical protein
MHKASNALTVLQAIAAIAGISIVLLSIGFPALRFAEAASVTSFSDTLSDSAPSVDSNHTIVFTTPTGVANASTITITFPATFTGTSSIVATDIDVATTSDFTVGATCGSVDVAASFGGTNTLTLTMCAAGGKSIPANGTTTIQIGNHANFGGSGSNQINNPAATGSYEIDLTAGASDSGSTRVAIVDNVTVSASVDTIFTFSVSGRNSGTVVNGHTTGGNTSPTTIPFGRLQANVASTAAQLLTVTTNARNGYAVTVQADGMLDSANGADIDGFANGAYTATPASWSAPGATPGSENTYGHWGITTDDTALISGADFSASKYVSASTTPVQVMSHTGPVNGSSVGVGTTTVGYRVQISALQEAAEDYQAVLTYVATPVF